MSSNVGSEGFFKEGFKGHVYGEVPTVSSSDEVVTIVCSDIHITATPPIARSTEKNWLLAQEGYLTQLWDLVEKHNVARVVYVGDIFHKWNAPPEAINFAIRNLPPGIAVPGQHDLPYHRYEDVERSAYWTLVEAGTVIDLGLYGSFLIRKSGGNFLFTGFPWGIEITRPPASPGCIQVLVNHQYVWSDETNSYPGVEMDKSKGFIKHLSKALEGYNIAVFGDNHKGWEGVYPSPNEIFYKTVYNCGALIPRNADERHYKPSVGLLYTDSSIKRFYLDTSKDVWADEKVDPDFIHKDKFLQFLDTLENITDSTTDFYEVILRSLNNDVSKNVKELILKALEPRK